MTLNPAPAIRLAASTRAKPSTSGTMRLDGPLLTTTRTVVPGATSAPSAGSWVITVPSGTMSSGDDCVTITRPDAVSARDAVARGIPVTPGTRTGLTNAVVLVVVLETPGWSNGGGAKLS